MLRFSFCFITKSEHVLSSTVNLQSKQIQTKKMYKKISSKLKVFQDHGKGSGSEFN